MLLILMVFYLPDFKPQAKSFSLNYIAAFKNKGVLYIFTYIFFISLIYHGIQQWLGVYFSDQYHLRQFTISMLITLTSLSGIFGEAIGGVFADKIGRVKTVNLGILLMIISVGLLIFKMPAFMLSLIMVIWGLGWTFNHAGISTMLTDVPKKFLHEAASLNSSVRFVSGGVGVAASGLIMQKSFIAGFTLFGSFLLVLLFCTKYLVTKI
jgi:predicted MFS family arabinose efflux permease